MRRARAAIGGLAALLAALGPAGGAAAATSVPDVAAALAADPLFLDPEAAGALGAIEQDLLRERIKQSATPVYLAVLPGTASTPGNGATPAPTPSAGPADLPAAIAAVAGWPGTFAVVAGTTFSATSTVLGDRAGELAAAAVADGGETISVLLGFVDAVELAAGQAEPPPAPADEADLAAERAADGGGEDQGPLRPPKPWVVAFAAVAGLLVFGLRRRR
jgi:hypothetical protein